MAGGVTEQRWVHVKIAAGDDQRIQPCYAVPGQPRLVSQHQRQPAGTGDAFRVVLAQGVPGLLSVTAALLPVEGDSHRWQSCAHGAQSRTLHSLPQRPADRPIPWPLTAPGAATTLGTMNETEFPMSQAISEAQDAAVRGEVPVGCVLVAAVTGNVIAAAGNRTEELGDPTAHAEMLAIREAVARHKTPRLEEVDMYVTLEPCAMCAAVISFARIRRLYFGAYDPKGGGVEHGGKFFSQPTCHHAPEVYGGMEETQCAHMLKTFFAEKR